MATMRLEKLAGSEGLRTFATSDGTTYCIGRRGRRAWPLWGSATQFGPYDTDVARSLGLEIDLDLPEDSYAVTHAGACWSEVYDHLLSLGAGA